jgi:hypothetical protein
MRRRRAIGRRCEHHVLRRRKTLKTADDTGPAADAAAQPKAAPPIAGAISSSLPK